MIEETERVKWCSQNILEYTEGARNRFLIAVIVVAVGLAIDYNMTTKVYIQNCSNPLEIAASGGTVELAKSRLEKAITDCSSLRNGNGPRGDGWRESPTMKLLKTSGTLIPHRLFVMQTDTLKRVPLVLNRFPSRLKGQVKALAQVKPTDTAEEKYFVIQQFRQTVRNVGERLDKEN